MTVDLLILLVGFIPRPETRGIASQLNLNIGSDGFLSPEDVHTGAYSSNVPGVFLCGTLKGPGSIENTIADARAAALQIACYLSV